MPYQMQWLVSPKIVDIKFDNVFTADELREYDIDLYALMNDGQPKQVHILIDVTDLQQFPNLTQAIQLKVIHHPNLGWSVLIGNKNPIVQTMGMLVARLFGTQVQWCTTRREALAYLQRMDKTLTLP